MGLYDVIDNIAEKKASRSDMGDNRIFGTVLGTVTENYNEDKPGRVCDCRSAGTDPRRGDQFD